MGDPGYIAAATASSVQDSVTELEIEIPDTASAGDRLLLAVCSAPATVTDDPPGWTRLLDTSAPPGSLTASGGRMLIWAAEAGSQSEVDPGATVTVGLSGSTRAVAGIVVYGPCDVDSVTMGSVSTMPGGGPYTRQSPEATAPDISRVVCLYGINGNDSTNDSVSWSADAATVERLDVASEAPNFRNVTLMVADEQAGPGTVGGRTATASHRTQACAVTIVLSSAVDRPTATASTPTPTVAAGTTGVQLLGDASGGAGAPYTYQWRQISGTTVSLSDPTAQNPTFTAPSTSDELVFGLVVTDSASVESLEATVTVTVLGASGRAVPVEDLTVAGWTTDPPGAPTVSSVLADNDDGTFAAYEDPNNTVLEVGLSTLTPPQGGEPVTLSVRVSQVAGAQGSVTVQLREGASTVITESGPHTWSTQNTVQEFSVQLTAGEVASISDWSDLRVRILFTVT